MKIAMVSENADPSRAVGLGAPGSQHVHVDALATGLIRLGHTVTVVTSEAAAAAPGSAPQRDYAVVRLRGSSFGETNAGAAGDASPEFAAQLGQLLSRGGYDVVHAHFWRSAWATRRAARAVGLPWAVTFHELGSIERRRLGVDDPNPACRVAVEATLADDADLVIAVCADHVRELAALGVDGPHICVVPGGVDLQRFTPRPPPVGPAHVLAFGLDGEQEGLADLVIAIAQLPGVFLTVVGGPERAELGRSVEARRLGRLAEGLGCAERIRLTGHATLAALPELLESADVVAITPRSVPVPAGAVEAMACARPLVATGVGALTDLVDVGVTGDIVPPGRPDALAAALDALLRDTERARRYGAQGAAVARAGLGWEATCRRTAAALATLCPSGAGV
ncbi:glycosyltransferase [Nocardioides sp.]|uniref:glycosyltransferase n=1 Tax=Nocardioides sp. TaxID=35761 RepID=UPI00260D2DDA|nr:glycosyltransferase [Nocardioides sp.]